ncbi:MAG: hypothetical protein AB8E82_14410 [Aureispira sp.]
MKLLFLLLLCSYSSLIRGQQKYKNHKFQAEFIALEYFLDSIVPFQEDLKDRLLVTQGEIEPAHIQTLINSVPDYKDLQYMYYKWEKTYLARDPNIPDTLYGGGHYCARRHGLKRMRYNTYRKRAEAGELISRINISSMVYDEVTDEKLVRISAELKNGLLDRTWYEVTFALLDGKIIYKKAKKAKWSAYKKTE